MSNSYFRFKQFQVDQALSAMKVTTDACLFGAWTTNEMINYKSGEVLDIGAGTGLLALMIAQKTESRIDAIEIDRGSATEAMMNVKASNWNGRINIIQGDVLNSLPAGKQYDVIVSNPPFYENEIPSIDPRKNVSLHEGRLVFQQVFNIIKDRLAPAGYFFILLPAKRIKQVMKIIHENQLAVSNLVSVRQTPAHDPFRFMFRGIHKVGKEKGYETKEIIIRDTPQRYSKDFSELLKDYYLEF